MTSEVSTVQQPPAPVILLHPQDPGTFSGTDGLDVEDWIDMYERVSNRNRWDPTVMLANAIFYLKGTARVWYQTHEEDLTSWDACKAKLRELFGRSFDRQQAAKKELGSRIQTTTESYISYIQDVLGLCRKVDAQMAEDDKISHILKGIADDAFNLLVCKDCTTVDAIVKECQRFEQAKSRRITRQFLRLPNTAATSSCEDPPTPVPATASEDVTRIVRRELEALAPTAVLPDVQSANLPTVSLIKAVVRQEFANMGLSSAVCSIRTSERTPANVTQNQVYPSRYRNPADWRTADDRPICFNCSRVGHIARHCRSSWSSPSNWSTGSWRRPGGNIRRFSPRSDPHASDASDAAAPHSRFSRSPSPQGRRSRSPRPYRSSSPARPGTYAPEN